MSDVERLAELVQQYALPTEASKVPLLDEMEACGAAEAVTELAAHPEAGDLIRHSGGLRKARMKLPGRGKSSGARVIYLWLPEARRVVLFMLYTKATRANIPDKPLATRPKYLAKIAESAHFRMYSGSGRSGVGRIS